MFNHDAFILVEPGELIIYSNHLISIERLWTQI